MKAVIQRVKGSSVSVDGKIIGRIGKGMLVLLGVAKGDAEHNVEDLVAKVAQLRMFEDEHGKMNLSAKECQAEFLVVSQFTLLANCDKGRRPSFDVAAAPEQAKVLYELFISKLRGHNFKVETGQFAAMMDVSLVNDGPVTFVLDG